MADGNAPNRVFLRKIIYRIDFQLITENLHEELFAFAAQEFGQYFAEQSLDTANAIDIEINANQLDQSRLSSKAQQVYVFLNPKTAECDGRTLKIGRTFLYLELDLNIKSMRISYYEWIAKIINKFKENPIFKLSRIGLRKFNFFYILSTNENILDQIFSIDYIPPVENNKFELDNFRDIQVYNTDNYYLNFSRNLSSGYLTNEKKAIDNQLAHQISFDFDLFSTNSVEISTFLNDAKVGLEKMNDIIYNFFASVISSDTIKKLNAGDMLEDFQIIPS